MQDRLAVRYAEPLGLLLTDVGIDRRVRVEPQELSIGPDESPIEGSTGQAGQLVPLDRLQVAPPDPRGRGDLTQGDAAGLALLSEAVPEAGHHG